MTGTSSTVESVIARAVEVLQTRPSALVTDVDGTLSFIVNRPEDATVSESIRAALLRLSKHLNLTAVITAREESMARRMVGVSGLTYVGNYALEASTRPAETDVMPLLITSLRPLLAEMPCVELEEKGISFSLHYRNCDEAGMRERLIARVQPVILGAGARIVEGKQVVEVVPAGLPDKGSALARLLEASEISGAVYLGDDLSDVPAFRELKRRQLLDDKPGLGIAVLDAETPLEVSDAADTSLDGVGQVSIFLNQLADALGLEGVNG